MSGYDLRQMWSADEGDQERDAKGKGTRSSRRAWTMLSSDTVNDTPELILNQALAQIGTALPGDSYRRIRSARCLRMSPNMFKIEASYVAEGEDPEDNPLNEPPVIEFDFADSEDIMAVDAEGQPVQNKNGEDFDPPPTFEVSDLVISVTRNNATFDPLLAWSYKGAISSDEFLGFPAGVCRIMGIRSGSIESDDFIYYKTNTIIHVRQTGPGVPNEKAWFKRILHNGFRVRSAPNAQPDWAKEIKEDGSPGPPVAKPINLTANGTRLADGAAPDWLYFRPPLMKILPFSGLGIL